MRRSSIITIIILILVIICLIVALVVTNLGKNDEEKEITISENKESLKNNEEEKEEPVNVSLDSQVVKDMYELLNHQIFHYFKKGYITAETLSDDYIQTIAYYKEAKNHVEEITLENSPNISGRLDKKYMDEAVKKIFGDIEYEPTGALYQDGVYEITYDANDGVYYRGSGFGGASNFGTYTAITKVEEYSDKYIVTEKLVSVELDYQTPIGIFNVYSYYGIHFQYAGYLGVLRENEIENLKVNHEMYSTNEKGKKIISLYYDDATEYKHTFVKNEDGSFYWQKTEIVK